jgi:hypothetical protein
MDITRDPQRSSLGRLSRRRDIAALALVFVFAAFANAALMVTPVSTWRDHIAANLKLSSTLPVTSAFFFLAFILVPLILVGGSVLAGRAIAGVKVPTCEMIGRFSLALVPLGSAMWAAHYLFHFLLGWDSALPVFHRVLGELGLAVASQSSSPAAGLLVSLDNLRILQTVLLDIGLLATLYLGWRIAQVHASKLRYTFGMIAPWGSVAVSLYAFGIWTCLQPMQMRGMATILSSMDAQDDWTRPRAIAVGVHARAQARQRSCPGGTSDNSPTLQRWVTVRQDISPEGTTESGSIQPSLRDSIATVLDPNAEALGYSQVSLRDSEGFGTAKRGVLDL